MWLEVGVFGGIYWTYRSQEAPQTCSNGLIRYGSITKSLLSGIEHKMLCSFSCAICRKPASFLSSVKSIIRCDFSGISLSYIFVLIFNLTFLLSTKQFWSCQNCVRFPKEGIAVNWKTEMSKTRFDNPQSSLVCCGKAFESREKTHDGQNIKRQTRHLLSPCQRRGMASS